MQAMAETKLAANSIEGKAKAWQSILPKIERHKITSGEQWLALRQQDVTASVAGALLGVHPYASPYSLWALKSGLLTEDPEETPPMRRGRLLEPVAVEMLREERPAWALTYPVKTYYREPKWRIGATPDVLATNEAGQLGVVQVKSVEPGVFRRTWTGEEGEVTPPLWIVCQAIVEAYLTGAKWAAVAALVVSHGVELEPVTVPIHGGIIERLKSEVRSFWYAVDNRKAPDPDLHRDAALIERLFNPTGNIADLSKDNELSGIIDERAACLANVRTNETKAKELKVSILQKLGDASGAITSDGRLVRAKRVNIREHIRKASSRIDIAVKSAVTEGEME
jgi:predicted phage-related endonuclease